MVMQKRAIAGCALLLASSAPSGEAFSPMQSFSIRRQLEGGRNNNNGNGLILMANFPPPMEGMGPGRSMGGRSMGRRSMGGPPPGRGGMGPGPMDGPGGPGGPMGGPGMGGPSMGMNARPLPRQGGGGGGNMGGQQSYNANSASPNGSNGNNAGNSPDGSNQQRGLGAIASGVSTPMDKYGNPRSPERPRRPGGYSDQSPRGVAGGFDERGPGPDPRFDDRGGDPRGGDPRGGAGGGRPQNLRYEERDYGEYVSNLRSGPGAPEPRRGGGGGGDIRDLEDEVERLRKENAMLKRSCQDLMNNFNEMSNRLFDVDESLKKVAKVFPSDDEMESLEWLLRR